MNVNKRMRVLVGLGVLGLSGPLVLRAGEYFVSPRGSDEAPGTAEAAAFATLGKGTSVLAAGDTLTVLPGNYRESLRLRLTGRPGALITIRAKHPGTVLMRGDVDLRDFERVPGFHYTWSVRSDRDVEGVGERDTAAVYAFVPSPEEVEHVRGACCYDRETQRLYVHTSDSAAPAAHCMVASVTNDFGMLFEKPAGAENVSDIVVDGIGFSGYMNREVATRPGGLTRWGLYFVEPVRCAVRRCTAFLNGGGIGLVRPVDCVIENCLAFGNFSTYSASGGNIISWAPATRTVHRNNIVHTTVSNGIRFYGGGTTECVMERNLAYDCGYGEIWIKGGGNSTSRMVGNVALGALHPLGLDPANITGNICRYGSGQENFDPSNIILTRLRDPGPDGHFADPVHHDYRLQADSPLRGTAPGGVDPGPFPDRGDVMFVATSGDDARSGTSVKDAWRTVRHAAEHARPGQTVYILPGKYAGPLTPGCSGTIDAPVVFARRGHGRVLIEGPGELEGLSDVHVVGLEFQAQRGAALTVLDSSRILLERCRVRGGVPAASAASTRGLRIRHCALQGDGVGVRLRECEEVELVANAFEPGLTAAVDLDSASSATLYSDHNAFPASAAIAVIDSRQFADLDRWRAEMRQDARSLRRAGTAGADKADIPGRQGRGPLATAIGPSERSLSQAPLRIEHVRVHAVSATTANVEWWTPTAEATTTLHWGPTRACEHTVANIFDGNIFHTVSLVGLQPGVTYFVRVSATKPVWEFHTNAALAKAERERSRETAEAEITRFRTLDADPPRQTYHVAPNGDDAHDGSSPERAWRTLRHAAAAVRAGDSVLIHGGSYEEHVPVRVSGGRDRPVTFRAAPGEKVWLDGSGQKRHSAFRLSFKHHVVLDGLYFRHFRAKPYNASHTGGAIHVVGGAHNVVRRCFYDGRTKTYMPHFIHAADTQQMLLENCVVIMGWNNVSFRRCPGLAVRNNVFYNGQIRAATFFNDLEQPVTFSHNLVCANIPQKVGNSLLSVWHLEAYRGDHNCYFARQGPDARLLLGYIRVGGEKAPGTLLLGDLQQRTGQERHSLFANPGIPVTPAVRLDYGAGEHQKLELHRQGMEIEPLDFRDFFADPAGPCGQAADGGVIGLDPRAFAAPAQ